MAKAQNFERVGFLPHVVMTEQFTLGNWHLKGSSGALESEAAQRSGYERLLWVLLKILHFFPKTEARCSLYISE